jgi:hypothetical protein
LDGQNFWYDEMISLHFAKLPQWNAIFWDNSPFLYNLILKIWLCFFNDSEFFVRLLSVVFSMATFCLYWFYGMHRSEFKMQLRLVMLYLLSTLSLIYAQEARTYAMFEFFATWNTMAFFNQLENPNRKNKWYYYCSLVFLGFSHYFSIFPIFIQAGFNYYQSRSKKILIYNGLLIFILMALFFENTSWKSMAWLFIRYELDRSSWLPYAVFKDLFFSSVPLCLGIVGLLGFDLNRWRALSVKQGYLVFMLLVPILFLSLLSLLSHSSVMLARYFIFLVPPLLFYLESKFAQWSVFAFLGFVIIAGLQLYRRGRYRLERQG